MSAEDSGSDPTPRTPDPLQGEMATAVDPICGMTVSTTSPLRSTRGGETFYFCSPSCKARFDADESSRREDRRSDPAPTPTPTETRGPDPLQTDVPREESRSDPQPTGAKPSNAPGQTSGSDPTPTVRYTCPMHPEVVQVGRGACPICGMALEPQTVTLDDRPNPELIDMRRRFVVSAILSVPLVAGMWLMLPPWVEMLLAAPVVLWGGWPFFQRGWTSVVTRQLNMFTLIAMGTGVSFG